MLCHYYGREAGLELREDFETVLEPGMVVSMEPMIMIPEGMPGAGGYREHDILVVTEDGQPQHHRLPLRARAPDRGVIRPESDPVPPWTRQALTMCRSGPRKWSAPLSLDRIMRRF